MKYSDGYSKSRWHFLYIWKNGFEYHQAIILNCPCCNCTCIESAPGDVVLGEDGKPIEGAAPPQIGEDGQPIIGTADSAEAASIPEPEVKKTYTRSEFSFLLFITLFVPKR